MSVGERRTYSTIIQGRDLMSLGIRTCAIGCIFFFWYCTDGVSQELLIAEVVAPTFESIIERIDVKSGERQTIAMLNDTLIVDMAIDGDGVIHLVDFRDLQRDLSQIRRLDKFGTELSPLKSSEPDLPIISVEVGPMGNIYYRTAGLGLIGVGRFEPNGNELDPLMQDRSVIGIGFDGNADVFVGFTENNGSTVERLSNDGSPIEWSWTTLFVPAKSLSILRETCWFWTTVLAAFT